MGYYSRVEAWSEPDQWKLIACNNPDLNSCKDVGASSDWWVVEEQCWNRPEIRVSGAAQVFESGWAMNNLHSNDGEN